MEDSLKCRQKPKPANIAQSSPPWNPTSPTWKSVVDDIYKSLFSHECTQQNVTAGSVRR